MYNTTQINNGFLAIKIIDNNNNNKKYIDESNFEYFSYEKQPKNNLDDKQTKTKNKSGAQGEFYFRQKAQLGVKITRNPNQIVQRLQNELYKLIHSSKDNKRYAQELVLSFNVINEKNQIKELQEPVLGKTVNELIEGMNGNNDKQKDIILCNYERPTKEDKDNLLSALKFIHQNGYSHNDISFNNVMLANKDDGSGIKLIDFGCLSKTDSPTNGAQDVVHAEQACDQLMKILETPLTKYCDNPDNLIKLITETPEEFFTLISSESFNRTPIYSSSTVREILANFLDDPDKSLKEKTKFKESLNKLFVNIQNVNSSLSTYLEDL